MSWIGYISRRHDPLNVEGFLSDDLGAILAEMSEGGMRKPGLPVVSDLSVGAWRAHQVGNEFADQLGIEPPEAAKGLFQPQRRGQRPMSGPMIEQWIDAEAAGKVGVLNALELATCILNAISKLPPQMFMVFLPPFGQTLGEVNLHFLRFFTEGLSHTGGRLIFVASSGEPACLPPGWQVEWKAPRQVSGTIEEVYLDSRWGHLPGVVPPNILAQQQPGGVAAVALTGGYGLILPSQRPRIGPTPQPGPPLQRKDGAPPWMVAYQQTLQIRGKPLQTILDLQEMTEYAWVCVEAGDIEAGLRLQQIGLEQATHPLSRAHMQTALQAMSLRAERYAEVGSEEERPRGLPAPVYDRWLRGKAYGATLAGDTNTARRCFLESQEFGHGEPETWDDLYARNLMALVFAREGNWERARGLQASIEEALAHQEVGNWHLRYLNALNTARLYRQRRLYDQASEYYSRAFAITDGVRVENDQFYANLCWARLEESCDHPDRAFVAWLRAGLHWAAASAPEAIGSRVAAILLERRVERESVVAEEVTEVLCTCLLRAAQNIGIDVSPAGEDSAPTFIYTGVSGLTADRQPITALAGRQWAVFARETWFPPPYDTASHRELRRVLWTLIRHIACPPSSFRPRTVQVDARYGREIPATSTEIIDCTVRLRAARLYARDTDVHFTSETHHGWEQESSVELAPGVSRIEQTSGRATVHFRRHWGPVALPVEATIFLDAATKGCRIKDLQAPQDRDNIINELRWLEAQHIVTITHPPTTNFTEGLTGRDRRSYPHAI
jgi:tetratricopeptide (TPR) repeat protein